MARPCGGGSPLPPAASLTGSGFSGSQQALPPLGPLSVHLLQATLCPLAPPSSGFITQEALSRTKHLAQARA